MPPGLPVASAVASGARAIKKAKPDLRKGMNFGDAMDAPNEGDWGVALASSDFDAVKEAGFDHVRVPMRVSAHASAVAQLGVEPRLESTTSPSTCRG